MNYCLQSLRVRQYPGKEVVMGIGAVGSSTSVYGQLASGSRLMTAADGPAEMAISEKMDSQVKSYDKGSDNAASGIDVANISDGALGNITDNLQRIRELALASMNTAVMTPSDIAKNQAEIDQLKQGIADIASQTTYNTKHLLDGTEDSFRLKTDPNGGEASVTAANATLESLGIADFDVTKDFDITKIDKALEKVQTQRSTAGAQSNALAYQVSVNSGASYNLTAANSRISDLDMAKGVNTLSKQRLLETVSVMMQKKRQEDEARRHLGLFT